MIQISKINNWVLICPTRWCYQDVHQVSIYDSLNVFNTLSIIILICLSYITGSVIFIQLGIHVNCYYFCWHQCQAIILIYYFIIIYVIWIGSEFLTFELFMVMLLLVIDHTKILCSYPWWGHTDKSTMFLSVVMPN